MGELNNREYYETRAATSRRLAERASDPSIGAIHVDLAERYEAMVKEARVDRQRA